MDEKYHITDKVLRNLIAHKERNERNGRGSALPSRHPPTKHCREGRRKKEMYDIVKIDRRGYVKRDQLKASCPHKVGGHGCGNHSDMDIILQRPRGDKGCTVYTEKIPHLDRECLGTEQYSLPSHGKAGKSSTESGGKQPYQQEPGLLSETESLRHYVHHVPATRR